MLIINENYIFSITVYKNSKVIYENYNVSDYTNKANLIYFYNLKPSGGGTFLLGSSNKNFARAGIFSFISSAIKPA